MWMPKEKEIFPFVLDFPRRSMHEKTHQSLELISAEWTMTKDHKQGKSGILNDIFIIKETITIRISDELRSYNASVQKFLDAYVDRLYGLLKYY